MNVLANFWPYLIVSTLVLFVINPATKIMMREDHQRRRTDWGSGVALTVAALSAAVYKLIELLERENSFKMAINANKPLPPNMDFIKQIVVLVIMLAVAVLSMLMGVHRINDPKGNYEGRRGLGVLLLSNLLGWAMILVAIATLRQTLD